MYGCEVWRDLDWLNDDEKVLLDCSQHQNIARALSSVFDSQIIGGKRYDLAVEGRRAANATFGRNVCDVYTGLNYVNSGYEHRYIRVCNGIYTKIQRKR